MAKSKGKNKTTLQKHSGIKHQLPTNESAISNFKKKRGKEPATKELIEGILSGDKVALSRSITLIESTNPRHREKARKIIMACLPRANQSIRIGITGVPGVGKSTFIEGFGKYLTSLGHKVAVLAVDPSSSISGGSILGDKTRMEELVKDDNAFIRPSPSGESLGGVSRKTRETIVLCEACGFDTLIIETVGVGQSETAVHSMVDFFLLLKLAGAGDELQGIKRGIMEMADAIVINKADGDNIKRAHRAKTDFTRALHLYPPKENGWTPRVLTASSTERTGLADTWKLIEDFRELMISGHHFQNNRKKQQKHWLLQTLDERLKTDFYQRPEIKKALKEYIRAVEENRITPFEAADYLFSLK